MPDDSAGNYTRPPGNVPVTGQTAQAIQLNSPVDDLSAAMTRRYMRDGRAPMLGNVPMNGYKATGAGNATDPQDYVTKAQLDGAIAAIAGIPTGSMMFMASNVIPAGWLALSGQSVSRATFAALWTFAQASGNLAATEGVKTAGQFGPGDGSATFTLPYLYADGAYFIRPISSGRGIGTIQTDDFKSHNHGASFAGNPIADHIHAVGASFIGSGTGSTGGYILSTGDGAITSPAGGHTPSGTVAVNAAGGTETRPKNIAYPVLIKT